MRLPTESYFKSVTLFEDIPVVMFSNAKSVSEAFLKALGVREHVDLQVIFDRLGDLQWDHIQLVNISICKNFKTLVLHIQFIFLK